MRPEVEHIKISPSSSNGPRGDPGARRDSDHARQRAKPHGSVVMKHARALILFAVSALWLWGCSKPLSVDWISIAYPPDKYVLILERGGGTRLVQEGQMIDGILSPRVTHTVQNGTFDIDRLFQELIGKQLLDEWDEGAHPIGVVRLGFNNDTSGTYHIADVKFLEEIFALARAHVADQQP